jgi:hypothetical protein
MTNAQAATTERCIRHVMGAWDFIGHSDLGNGHFCALHLDGAEEGGDDIGETTTPSLTLSRKGEGSHGIMGHSGGVAVRHLPDIRSA